MAYQFWHLQSIGYFLLLGDGGVLFLAGAVQHAASYFLALRPVQQQLIQLLNLGELLLQSAEQTALILFPQLIVLPKYDQQLLVFVLLGL
jgi:hypothetical protein